MFGFDDLKRCSGCRILALVDPQCLVQEERCRVGLTSVSFDNEKAGCEKGLTEAASFYLKVVR